ncbi:MAG TPA: SurA N-terminal domain-containing protein [Hyphomicrobium zavarzinii]|nr:SurA N-terminal domain-containing protein [Hyphomicrobium zavarzinii]
MLDALRRGAQGWLAKLLFAVLIVSFGIFWNVADVFRGFGRGSVAKVGDTDITVTDFQRAFQSKLRSVQLQDGGLPRRLPAARHRAGPDAASRPSGAQRADRAGGRQEPCREARPLAL